jgi:acetyltransferase-like isoleucine patch superfamily enzyme
MIQAGGIIEVGEDVLIGPGAKIWSANHGFSDPSTPIQDQEYENKKVIIGNGCWIGANAFLMPGVNLGEGCIVSAGAIVGAKNYPPYKIIAGNPARVIGTRELNPAQEVEAIQNKPQPNTTD